MRVLLSKAFVSTLVELSVTRGGAGFGAAGFDTASGPGAASGAAAAPLTASSLTVSSFAASVSVDAPGFARPSSVVVAAVPLVLTLSKTLAPSFRANGSSSNVDDAARALGARTAPRSIVTARARAARRRARRSASSPCVESRNAERQSTTRARANAVAAARDMPPRDDGGDADDATDVERALIARLPPFLRRARAEDVARVATEVFGIGAKVAPLTSIEDVVRLLVRCETCGRVVLEDGLVTHALRRCDGGAAARDANANASASAKNKANATSERGGGATGERKAVGRADRGMGRTGAGGVGRGAKLGGRESRTREPNYGKPKPLATRVDVRAMRRVRDATVFAAMYHADLQTAADDGQLPGKRVKLPSTTPREP